MTVEHVSRHHGLLGTVLDLRLQANSPTAAAHAEAALVEEVQRLEKVFNVFDPQSELSRWKRDEIDPGSELTEVLAMALHWQSESEGAFNPEVGALLDLWRDGAEHNVVPDRGTLSAVAERISTPGYAISSDNRVRTLRPMGSFDLNAIAKGWIVDRATSRVSAVDDSIGLMVNAGGDLLNCGLVPMVVGIEDPFRPFDNVPPKVRVRVDRGLALATSGGARRGWRIGESWFSHVIDPRTGLPTDHIRSATVVGPSSTRADVTATILTILEPDAGLDFSERLGDVECLLVTSDGEMIRSRSWAALEIS